MPERCAHVHRNDFRPRHHDVLDAQILEAQRLLQHGALARREGRAVVTAQRLLDHGPRIGLTGKTDFGRQTAEPSRPAFLTITGLEAIEIVANYHNLPSADRSRLFFRGGRIGIGNVH
jgi:hypothetical protein